MSRRRPELTPAIRAEAEAIGTALDKVQKHRPTLEDYVSEGVIDHIPEGKFSIPVNGARVLQMNDEANRLAAWHGDNQAESPSRRARREQRAEKLARLRHSPRASIVVPEMPWKRRKRREVE